MNIKWRNKVSWGKKKEGEFEPVRQFIYDHSTPVPKGWYCCFYWKNSQDLRSRIAARKFGLERLTQLDKEWKEVQTASNDYDRLKKVEKKLNTGWRKIVYDIIR